MKLTPVSLPGKSHEQKSLVGHSPQGHRRVRHDLVTKQQTNTFTINTCTFFLFFNSYCQITVESNFDSFFEYVCNSFACTLILWKNFSFSFHSLVSHAGEKKKKKSRRSPGFTDRLIREKKIVEINRFVFAQANYFSALDFASAS